MRHCPEAPPAGAVQFTSRRWRPRASGPNEDHNEVENLRPAAHELEAQLEEQRDEVPAITLGTVQALQRGWGHAGACARHV